MFITNNKIEYNISDEITEYAKVKNLDFIGTGGGYDYVFKKLKNGKEIILGQVKMFKVGIVMIIHSEKAVEE